MSLAAGKPAASGGTPMKSAFVLLRCPSYYSLLEGTASPETLLRQAGELGFEALGLTDSNNLFGTVEFCTAGPRFGVRPILGARLTQHPESVTALVADSVGYRNLCAIISALSWGEVPSFADLLARNAAGLHLLIDTPNLFRPPLLTAFAGRLWAEVVRPGPGAAAEKELLNEARSCGAPPVASPRSPWAVRGGDHLRCLVRGEALPRERSGQSACKQGKLLPSPETVAELFDDLPEALTHAARLAARLRSEVLPRGQQQPPVRLRGGEEPMCRLRKLCEDGPVPREWAYTAEARRLLERELNAIDQRDLAPHFLILAEVAEEARRHGWPVSLVGSAAASIVCHLLGITLVDPLRHGLGPERFLRWEPDMPEIVLEVPEQAATFLRRWLRDRHGHEYAARVGSVLRLKHDEAVRRAARAHLGRGEAERLADVLAEMAPHIDAEELPGAFAVAPAGVEPELWSALLDDTRLLLNRPYQFVEHPSAIVLTAVPTRKLVALNRGTGGDNICQLDPVGVGQLHLFKLDLRGHPPLSSLAEIDDHLRQLGEPAEAVGAEDDFVVLALSAVGDTLGLPGLEDPAVPLAVGQLRPASVPELAQALALARFSPGRRADRRAFLRRLRGRDPVRWMELSAGPVPGDGHRVVLFEEDALAWLEEMTGLPAPLAEEMWRGLEDRDPLVEANFWQRCSGRDASAAEILRRLAQLEDRCPARSRVAADACVAGRLAALKARHPVAFWTACLNHLGSDYPPRVYVEGAKRAGLSVLGPCVNSSRVGFTPEGTAIRAGLTAIRGLAPGAVEAVLRGRGQGGLFRSFAHLQSRLRLERRDLELLVRAGAFNFAGRSPRALLRDVGCDPDRDPTDLPPDPEPWVWELPTGTAFAWQRRQEALMLGFLPGTPLLPLLRRGLPENVADSRTLPRQAGRRVRLVGLVARWWGHGRTAWLTVEDEWGLVAVRAPVRGSEPAPAAEPGALVIVEGRGGGVRGLPWVVASTVRRFFPSLAEGRIHYTSHPLR
jgi:DNA polymerase III alpha subunit